MKVSRKAFLRAGAAALVEGHVRTSPVVAGLVSWLAGARQTFAADNGTAVARRFRIEHVSAASFRPYVNSAFSVSSGHGRRTQLVLSAVVEQPITMGVEQFSLIFRGPADSGLQDGTYLFEHQTLGTMDFFIVPVGDPSGRCRIHEACFSRM